MNDENDIDINNTDLDSIEEAIGSFFPEISKTDLIKKGQFKLERFDIVPFSVNVVLGRKSSNIKEIEKYKVKDIIELNKEASSLMTVYVNGVPLFYGEVLIINNMFGIRITQIIDEKINLDNYLKDINYTLEKSNQLKKPKSFNKKRFYDIDIDLRVEIGQIKLTLKKILESDIGSVLELNKSIDDPIIVYGNNIPLFKGKIVIINENFGLEITEIID